LRTPFFQGLNIDENVNMTGRHFVYESAMILKRMIEESGNGALLSE